METEKEKAEEAEAEEEEAEEARAEEAEAEEEEAEEEKAGEENAEEEEASHMLALYKLHCDVLLRGGTSGLRRHDTLEYKYGPGISNFLVTRSDNVGFWFLVTIHSVLRSHSHLFATRCSFVGDMLMDLLRFGPFFESTETPESLRLRRSRLRLFSSRLRFQKKKWRTHSVQRLIEFSQPKKGRKKCYSRLKCVEVC